ncbi:uncharacterized protein LOC141710577 [Apium graveolens]|uniref:uncharacterized protein LOC141710577 n=1 Tax=Apium graveolens TaxID=4045 RepID=UPI003D79F8C7
MKLNMKQSKEVSSSYGASSNEEIVELDKKIEEALVKHKEIKRQLQIATNKLAMLNKEEKAERRMAREAMRAEREAAERQKKRDKRARRKDRKNAAINEVFSEGEEFVQPENAAMEPKVNPIKQAREVGLISVPKIILKRKKARKIGAWAARAAAVVVVLIACCYLF